jgi:hypothetical protein
MTIPPEDRPRARRAASLPPDVDEAVKEEVIPSDRHNVVLISLGAVVLAVIGIVLTIAFGLGWLGVAACAIAFILAVLAIVMAYGDARAGVLTPILAGVASLIALIIVALNASGAAERIEEADPAEAIVPEVYREERLPDDPADLAAPPRQDDPPPAEPNQ